MADKDYKAFIVEGEAREPQVIDNISKVFFKHGNCNYSEAPLFKDEIWMTRNCIFDCFVSIVSLLMCRTNVGHDFQIIPDAFLSSEASGYFGLDLYHPKITFRLVVIKRDIEVINKKAD